ncbi:hydrolase, alpha/beta hydrolase fold family protein [Erythrobacter sp. NAP1]|uniref:alpha/beta fold hydrolase n=1 Tax=Erythrobacter sp. NAP1 TaxID=237727 RepID=UPI0000686C7B|nr:alpha/beta hydrolase [Erythrobacter sp. NAP1]EAQ29426.1 hydrolase, alpha/beta hydrolase fold family protein [Erythrobacter sp. NAP1]
MKWALRIIGVIAALLVVLFLIFRTPDTDADEMRAKYGGAPSQFVEIDGGVTVHLRDEGPRDGLPIILLHGSNADLHTWEPWAQGLRDTYRVIRFDQVGHGLTGPDPQHDYSRENYAEDIREVADSLGLDRFVIGGNSMGGKHTLAFASAYPERVIGMVLVDAGGVPRREVEVREDDDDSGNIGFAIARTPGINRIAEQITPRSLIAQSLEQSVSVEEIVTENMIDRYWELLRYPGNRAATMARFSTEYQPLTREEIAQLSMPTLILWGDEDRLIPVSAGRWLDETLPQSELVIYEGIGHLPQEETAEPSLRDLRSWLGTLEQG